MARLSLLRHGSAEWPAGRYADFDRPLDDAGRAQARTAGEALARLADGEVTILSSSARRTRETADIVGEALAESGRCSVHSAEDPGLYLASGRVLQDALRTRLARAPASHLLLVGHNLGLSVLARQLGLLGDRLLATGEWASLPDYQPDVMP